MPPASACRPPHRPPAAACRNVKSAPNPMWQLHQVAGQRNVPVVPSCHPPQHVVSPNASSAPSGRWLQRVDCFDLPNAPMCSPPTQAVCHNMPPAPMCLLPRGAGCFIARQRTRRFTGDLDEAAGCFNPPAVVTRQWPQRHGRFNVSFVSECCLFLSYSGPLVSKRRPFQPPIRLSQGAVRFRAPL
eukprot:6208463-Pleurochrysis_carterae.AAC.1